MLKKFKIKTNKIVKMAKNHSVEKRAGKWLNFKKLTITIKKISRKVLNLEKIVIKTGGINKSGRKIISVVKIIEKPVIIKKLAEKVV